MAYNVVRWNGREYGAQEGARVLIRIIMAQDTDPAVRVKALSAVRVIRDLQITEQLVSLYPNLREADEKAGVVECLLWSGDPRALPMFAKILDKEQNRRLRLGAAHGLAEWNIRRGVQELIALIQCKPSAPECASIRDQAANSFRMLNQRKSWGFPESDIIAAIAQANPNATPEESLVLFTDALQKWFDLNEHRFPDWKPGDPLPEAETTDRPQP